MRTTEVTEAAVAQLLEGWMHSATLGSLWAQTKLRSHALQTFQLSTLLTAAQAQGVEQQNRD